MPNRLNCYMAARSLVITFFIFGLVNSVSAQISNPALRDELLAMEKVDQAEREKCNSGSAEARAKCYVEISERVDKSNTRRLEQIFETHGFPGRKLVGLEGVRAFMLLLQHAPDDRLREKCEKPIERAFKAKELLPQDYSSFIDRFRLHQGKGQLYGTGFEMKDGKMVLSKTEDIKNLEKRRKKIGLPPLSEYIQMLKDAYRLQVETPILK